MASTFSSPACSWAVTPMATKKKPETVVERLRCWRCGKVLAEVAPPGTMIRCMQCGAKTRVP